MHLPGMGLEGFRSGDRACGFDSGPYRRQGGTMLRDPEVWTTGLRVAGLLHFVTLGLACLTPIPPNWDENLAKLPEVHRRFAVTQNFFIGGVIAACGLISVAFAPALVEGSPLARAVCAGIALWWGGRLAVLPWLGAHRHLTSAWLRLGYGLLLAECATYTAAFGYLALR